MTEKQQNRIKLAADFLIPLIDAGLMLAICFGTALSAPLKIAALIFILLIGNIVKYEIKKNLAARRAQQKKPAR